MKKSLFINSIVLILLAACTGGGPLMIEHQQGLEEKTSSSANPIFIPAPKNTEEAIHFEKEAAETPIHQWVEVHDPHYTLKYPSIFPGISMFDTWTPSMASGRIPILSCAPSITGASKTSPLEKAGGKAEWGRVDFFEQYGGDGYIDYVGPQPLCAQPSSAKSRYALCSEKNGKTVVICISQMKDDPELAKKIFETFRWTK